MFFSIFNSAKNVYANNENEIIILYGDLPIEFPDQQPIIENDTVLIPIRMVFELMGFTVNWNSRTSSAIISGNNRSIVVPYGQNEIFIDSIEFIPDIPIRRTGNRLLMTPEVLSTTIGTSVYWNSETQIVVIQPLDGSIEPIMQGQEEVVSIVENEIVFQLHHSRVREVWVVIPAIVPASHINVNVQTQYHDKHVDFRVTYDADDLETRVHLFFPEIGNYLVAFEHESVIEEANIITMYDIDIHFFYPLFENDQAVIRWQLTNWAGDEIVENEDILASGRLTFFANRDTIVHTIELNDEGMYIIDLYAGEYAAYLVFEIGGFARRSRELSFAVPQRRIRFINPPYFGDENQPLVIPVNMISRFRSNASISIDQIIEHSEHNRPLRIIFGENNFNLTYDHDTNIFSLDVQQLRNQIIQVMVIGEDNPERQLVFYFDVAVFPGEIFIVIAVVLLLIILLFIVIKIIDNIPYLDNPLYIKIDLPFNRKAYTPEKTILYFPHRRKEITLKELINYSSSSKLYKSALVEILEVLEHISIVLKNRNEVTVSLNNDKIKHCKNINKFESKTINETGFVDILFEKESIARADNPDVKAVNQYRIVLGHKDV